jgi:hypothetical protein
MTSISKGQDKEEEDDLTLEERLQWLRDRGVVVETPQDRKGPTATTTTTTSSAEAFSTPSNCTVTNSITYVYIPADKAKPLQDCQFVPPSNSDNNNNNTTTTLMVGGNNNDPLAQFLKATFASNADQFDINLFRQIQSENPIHQLVAGGGGDGGDGPSSSTTLPMTVSNETLLQVATGGGDGGGTGHVETFVLVRPMASNHYTAVTLYLDEIGQLKRLPLNLRASELARSAGYHPPPIFYGDMFVARTQQKRQQSKTSPDDKSSTSSTGSSSVVGWQLPTYLDLTASECHVEAPWLQQGAMDNLEYQMQFNSMTGNQKGIQQQQPSVVGSDGVAKIEKGYSWTQSEEEIELIIPLVSTSSSSSSSFQSGTTTAAVKDNISVTFKPRMVQVKLKQDDDTVLLSIDLFERVDVDGCTWTMEKGKDSSKVVVVLTLEKAEEALWPRLVQ